MKNEVPKTLVPSGSSSLENEMAPFVSSLAAKQTTDAQKIEQTQQVSKFEYLSRYVDKRLSFEQCLSSWFPLLIKFLQDTEKAKAVRAKTGALRQGHAKAKDTPVTAPATRGSAKSTIRKSEVKVPAKPINSPIQPEEEEENEFEDENPSEIGDNITENEESDLIEGDDEDEEQSLEGEDKDLKLGEKQKRKAALNRALRIKMGKCGIQAASKRAIKSGKDAQQRKLWNQQVSG